MEKIEIQGEKDMYERSATVLEKNLNEILGFNKRINLKELKVITSKEVKTEFPSWRSG